MSPSGALAMSTCQRPPFSPAPPAAASPGVTGEGIGPPGVVPGPCPPLPMATPISRIKTVCDTFIVCPAASASEALGCDPGVFLATDKVQRRYQDRV